MNMDPNLRQCMWSIPDNGQQYCDAEYLPRIDTITEIYFKLKLKYLLHTLHATLQSKNSKE